MNVEEKVKSEKGPAANITSGLDNKEKIAENIKKEASHPGGAENAAGADHKEKEDFNKFGSMPVPDESINRGNKE